jgi:predicted MFS family arabinose efflux permease
MSAANGIVNRAVVTVVLAVVPLVGITLGSVFGLVAGVAAALLVVAAWLPQAPVSTTSPATTNYLAQRRRAPRSSRTITIAGYSLLGMYALWAISEDSVWALAGKMGADQAGLSDARLGLVLSTSSAGGLAAAAVLTVVGARFGRAVPIALLLLVGGALKLSAALTTDPVVYTVVLVLWNTAYMAVFLLFIATAAALDSNGRFSGPVIGVYLFGSSFSPVIGGWLAESFGYAGFGWAIAIVSWALVIPMIVVARVSVRTERNTPDRHKPATVPKAVTR